MLNVRVFVAMCVGVAVLAAGCGGKSEPATSGDAASKAELKALEKRVADLEAKGASSSAPAPGGDLAAKLAALEAKVNSLGSGSGSAGGVAGPAPVIGVANDKGKDLWGCAKVDKGLAVNGKADAAQWKKAKQVQLVSDEGKRLACDSTVAICHDTENLYIAAICMESAMGKLKLTCKNRDDKIYSDDCIEFYIDPELDRNDAVKFVVNPDGVFMDFMRDTHGDAGDVTWNATVKTTKLADRFIMEIAIPFKDMGVKYKPGMEIGFNAYRMRTINGESSTWWGECNKIDSIGKVVLE
ncbi:MAG TPA: hypothetical protein PK280_01915 [Planctomycetota bacterium]|nr:hypothetical protein [Planctomycetota bacterium]